MIAALIDDSLQPPPFTSSPHQHHHRSHHQPQFPICLVSPFQIRFSATMGFYSAAAPLYCLNQPKPTASPAPPSHSDPAGRLQTRPCRVPAVATFGKLQTIQRRHRRDRYNFKPSLPHTTRSRRKRPATATSLRLPSLFTPFSTSLSLRSLVTRHRDLSLPRFTRRGAACHRFSLAARKAPFSLTSRHRFSLPDQIRDIAQELRSCRFGFSSSSTPYWETPLQSER
ncbi:hypothetical protein RIF29_20948 [Crotalaria pallida]|uniref:Uncharacterized protein n=1 Tax=Crotalaria pallida TaxID=3830 RepID=A0AAN9I5I5_CROPI